MKGREEEEVEGTSGQMEKSEQGRSQFIAQGPRRGKAKRRAQLTQKLKRR